MKKIVVFVALCLLATNIFAAKTDNNIKTICLDLTSDNIAAMMNGHLDFLVGQRPGLQGFLAVETLLKNIICGGHPEVENYMPLDIITRENIDFYKEYVVQNSTGGVENNHKEEK